MPTALSLFGILLRKLTPAEVDANFTNLRTTADAAASALGGFTASQAPGAGQIPVLSAGGVLPLAGGIKFPAAQVASSDANTLDDYEEGTWTPALIGETTAGVATTGVLIGTYTKIGRMVRINCRVQWSAHTGTGALRITGLPFGNVSASALSVWASNLAIGAGKQFTAYVGTGGTFIRFGAIDPAGGAIGDVAMDASGDIFVTGTYEI